MKPFKSVEDGHVNWAMAKSISYFPTVDMMVVAVNVTKILIFAPFIQMRCDLNPFYQI